MTTTITTSKSNYETIVSVYETLKQSSLASDDELKPLLDVLKALLITIDSENSLERFYLCVKWHDLSANPADNADCPPQDSATLYSYVAFTQQFVTDFVAAQTNSYANILVTDDPSGNVGWLDIDTFFS